MIHASQAMLAYHLPYWTGQDEVPFAFMLWIEAGSSPQPYKRNRIIQRFLDSDCDILMMIDDDMIVDKRIIGLLNTPDYDVVGPLQYTMKGIDPDKGRTVPECFPCAFNAGDEDGQMLPVWPKQGDVAKVDIVGSGVIAIRRCVLEDSRMLHEADLDPPAFFRDIYLANGRRTRGLDVDFCRRATELGYRVRVNWGIEVGHFKRVNLNDIDLYAKSQFMMGLRVGGNNEIRLEKQEDGAADRSGGAPGPGKACGSEMAPQRMDRASRRRAARAAARAGR